MCVHGPVITAPHWSCCGATSRDAPCARPQLVVQVVAPATPAVAGVYIQQNAGESGSPQWQQLGSDNPHTLRVDAGKWKLSSASETFSGPVSSPVCPPEKLTAEGAPGREVEVHRCIRSRHDGEWRPSAMSQWCKLTPSDQGTHLCRHRGGVICATHWSCCGSQEESSGVCLRRCAHQGEWRTGRAPFSHHCKLTDSNSGLVLCAHGSSVVPAPHWSCCGALSMESTCSSS